MFVHPVRNEKLFILGPAVAPFRELDFFIAERLTMSRGRVLLVRRAITDMTIKHNECRSALRLLEDVERLLDPLTIVGVSDSQHVPSVSEEASCNILSERQTSVPLDRDVVVVVDPAKIVEAEMTGKRCRFRRNSLHQTAISANGVDVVVEDFEAGFIEAASEPLLADSHADARGNTLAQWSSRGLDTRYPVVLGVTRRLAV